MKRRRQVFWLPGVRFPGGTCGLAGGRRGPPSRCSFRFILLAAASLAAVAGPRLALAYERFTFDQRYLIQPGFIIKDHFVVKAADDSFHIFYIKADESLPESQRAKALGHATSVDLAHWNFRPDVIPVVPDTWEESYIWAPHIVLVSGVYYMFYTGVNRNIAQAVGLAVSTDLYHWVKYGFDPVYEPSTSWASWSPSTWSNCRDPFVFLDTDGLWYMTTTAWTNDSKGALSLASSTDLAHWTDLGPLLVHPGPNAWHVLESSNVIELNGAYHLFLTEENTGTTVHMQAPTLRGPWDFASREPFDAGAAAEVYQIGGQWMLSRHTAFSFQGAPRYTIKFDDLNWPAAGKPIVQPVDPLAGWTMVSGDAFYLQPTFWDNTAERGAGPSNFGGNSWIGTSELFTGPLQVGYPGQSIGDEPVGVMRSPTFTLAGNRLSFRIGGGRDLDRLYVALYTADDLQMQVRATGDDSETMRSVVWDVSAWAGRPVFLEIADESSVAWGHINVDEILESDAQSTAAGPPVPRALALRQNVPNPFNPSTRLALDLPVPARARLAVFDARGRLVRSLIDAPLQAGTHFVAWNGTRPDGTPAPSGVYFCRLQVDGFAPLTRSMTLVK